MRRFISACLLVLLLTALCAASAFAAFDEAAFRKNFVAGLAGRANLPPLTADSVRVEHAEKAADFAGTEIYVVTGALVPAEGQAQPFTMFVSADGRYYLPDLVDLSQGRSVLKEARDRTRMADLKDLGHVVFKGTGAQQVVYVSDPFCPYCRSSFAYLLNKADTYGEFRLVHFPLTSHPGADIACALMAWAEAKAPKRLPEFVRFAYVELAVPHVADRSPANMKKAWVEVAGAFLARFPELKALGKDAEAIVAALGNSPYVKEVAADMARAAGMDISGTPVIFVGGVRVDGFDEARLNALLK